MISLTNISSYAILTTRLPTTKYTKKAIKLVDIVANEDNVTNIAHLSIIFLIHSQLLIFKC